MRRVFKKLQTIKGFDNLATKIMSKMKVKKEPKLINIIQFRGDKMIHIKIQEISDKWDRRFDHMISKAIRQ